MELSKKILKTDLADLGIELNKLYVGKIITYSGCNHSGSPIGSAIVSQYDLFIKGERSYFKLQDILNQVKYLKSYPDFEHSNGDCEIIFEINKFNSFVKDNNIDSVYSTVEDLYKTVNKANNISKTR